MATGMAEPAAGGTAAATEHLKLEDRLWLLRAMLLMRGLEERAMTLYRQGKVPGSFYDGFGQEAVSAGAAFAMAPEDRLCILHRDLAAHIIRGVSPARILAQYQGRAAGITRRARRQRALRRPRARLRRDGLDAARHDACRHRHGDGVQAARRAPVRDDLVRRRVDLPRRLPRGDELGRRAEAAGRVRAREQPVRLLDAAGQAVRGGPGRACRRLRVRRRDRRRQRRRGDVRGARAWPASGPSPATARR